MQCNQIHQMIKQCLSGELLCPTAVCILVHLSSEIKHLCSNFKILQIRIRPKGKAKGSRNNLLTFSLQSSSTFASNTWHLDTAERLNIGLHRFWYG